MEIQEKKALKNQKIINANNNKEKRWNINRSNGPILLAC